MKAITWLLVWSSGCFVFPGMEGQPCTERGLCGVGLACDPSSQVCRDERFLCTGLQCGEVAGVNCGTCSGSTEVCESNQCVNVCAGLTCGEVAGISCGTCSGSTEVCESNQCVNVCAGLECGDVAGISCGTCSGSTEVCESNQCVNVCAGLQCGEVAGISCGTCSGSTEVCYSNRCIDVCAGLQCGEVAGISCGTCTGTDRCELNYCVKDGMVLVPGGPFFMGCNDAVDTQCYDNERPGRMVEVPVFQIDQFEVTVAAYEDCERERGCTPPNTGGACNWNRSDRRNHPINCVDHAQAATYCRWAQKRLPTEAEWEKAARGTDGRVYPWGNTFDATRANVFGTGDGFAETAPVDSFPTGASPYDALNMAGNVWEWTDCDQSDCYIRGGGWDFGPGIARASARLRNAPGGRDPDMGFRCAHP